MPPGLRRTHSVTSALIGYARPDGLRRTPPGPESNLRLRCRAPERPAILGGGWRWAFPGGTPSRDAARWHRARPPGHPGQSRRSRQLGQHRALGAGRHRRLDPGTGHGRIERERTGRPRARCTRAPCTSSSALSLSRPRTSGWRALASGRPSSTASGSRPGRRRAGHDDDLYAYRRLAEAGELTGRVIVAQLWIAQRGLDQLERLIDGEPANAIGRIRADRVKILLDGVVENFTAAMLEPYLDADGRPTTNRGMD